MKPETKQAIWGAMILLRRNGKNKTTAKELKAAIRDFNGEVVAVALIRQQLSDTPSREKDGVIPLRGRPVPPRKRIDGQET